VVATQAPDVAINTLGYVGVGMVIVMFGGPLATIKTVLKEKSTASLPFGFTIASFVNCVAWTGYGAMVIHDPFIWVPNALGLASSIAQLGLFAKFGFAKAETAEVEDTAETSETETKKE
jgi:solute carrier family 50 protein (sugar transporter)